MHIDTVSTGSAHRRLAVLGAAVAVMLVAPLTAGATTGATAGTTAVAGSGAVVDTSRYLIGGCTVAFSSYGVPRLQAERYVPCIGAQSVAISPSGDLTVTLAQKSQLPVLRLLVSPGIALTRRGIAAGISGGKSTLAVRLYDDLLGRRLDLRRSDDRRRLGATGGVLFVGWTKAAPVGTEAAGIDPGYNALGAYHDLATSDAATVQGGCAIRFDTGIPKVLANASHICTGVKSVGITSTGRLRVTLSDEQRGSLVNVEADPDETLTQRGILMGSSGGLTEFHFQFYDSRLGRALNLTWAKDRSRIAGTTSNVWLSWTKTAKRPGAVNASTAVAPNKYGPYMNGSSASGSVIQTGCSIAFSQVDGKPYLNGSASSLCSGVESVSVTSQGYVRVVASSAATAPVMSTTTVSSRAITDYGVRAGLSGGGGSSTYRMYSLRLGRTLNLTIKADRLILQRSGSSLLVGWSRPRV